MVLLDGKLRRFQIKQWQAISWSWTLFGWTMQRRPRYCQRNSTKSQAGFQQNIHYPLYFNYYQNYRYLVPKSPPDARNSRYFRPKLSVNFAQNVQNNRYSEFTKNRHFLIISKWLWKPKIRNYGIQDNLFLDRYAESVTRNGREIPANMTGIWAVKNEDINQLLEMSSGKLSKTCILLVKTSYWLKFSISWKLY